MLTSFSFALALALCWLAVRGHWLAGLSSGR